MKVETSTVGMYFGKEARNDFRLYMKTGQKICKWRPPKTNIN